MNVDLELLAHRIENIANHWKGANGGIYTIRAMSLELARELLPPLNVGSAVSSRSEIAERILRAFPDLTWSQAEAAAETGWPECLRVTGSQNVGTDVGSAPSAEETLNQIRDLLAKTVG